KRFEGRKLGILVSDGTDDAVIKAMLAEINDQNATFEVIAPKIGGVTLSDGYLIESHMMIDGGPSVLYDAVALLNSAE
ncbi:catalase HPII, partial [Rhizobium brockwellii]